MMALIPAAGAATALAAWFATGFPQEDYLAALDAAHRLAERLRAACDDLRARARSLVARLTGAADAPGASLAEVSEMIDVVRLGLSAGLSFDAALDIYCSNRTSELARQLVQAKASWQMGVCTREQALLLAADALGARSLESFATSVGQALSLGAPLVQTLTAQSREIRAAHRAQVERQIERAPVKLLIPTGTLILPALLLSIMGPLLAAGGML